MAARILVADDDATLQKLLMHSLKLEGYEVLIAADGGQTMEVIQRDHPDLVVLDVMMPVHNGFEICQMLRARPETAALPVIMLSGLSDVQEKVSGLRAGADEYLTKPIDLRELSARIDALLKRNQLLRLSGAPKAGRVITVIGAKGGVGATTLTLNVAALFAKGGKAVVAAELRPDYGSFAAQLRTPAPERNLSGLLAFEAPAISDPMVASHLIPTTFGVRVLYGPQQITQYAELEATRTGAIVGRMVTMADFVVIDLPTMATPAHETVIKNSGFVLLALEPEVSSVAAAAFKLRQLDAWGARGPMVKLIVVNRQGTMMLSLREIENRVEHMIDAVIPPASEQMSICMQYGTPLVLYQADHVASQNLADFIGRMGEKPVKLPR